MKRSILLSFVLSLVVPVLAAVAAPVPQPSAEELRSAIFSPADPATPDAAPAGATWKGTCTVTNDCGPYSTPISCTSAAGDCKSGTSATGVPFVKCDGVRTNCAPCHVQTFCPNGGGTISCTGTTPTSCLKDRCFVKCDSTLQRCANCIDP